MFYVVQVFMAQTWGQDRSTSALASDQEQSKHIRFKVPRNLFIYFWISQVLEHMTLIKDSKKSTVAQYIRKTLAKKRLSVEKAASSAGGDESAKSGGNQTKEESEKFVSLLSKVCLNLYYTRTVHVIDIMACVILPDFLIISYPCCVYLSLSHSSLTHTNTHTYTHIYRLLPPFHLVPILFLLKSSRR